MSAAFQRFRARLEAQGFRPSRRLGQNFLVDENMLRAIARDAGIRPGDFVLEIGPGSALLSLELVALGARLLAIELDARLAEHAREELARFPDARVLQGDVLASKHALAAELVALLPREGPWIVAANLPYGCASPALASLARLPNPPQRMCVLVQAEVAERIAARPDTSAWGPLSTRLQSGYACERVRRVAASLFWPRPQVESELVRLELRADRPGPEALARLDALVSALFQQRRKSLAAGLAAALGGGPGARARALELLARCELAPLLRAEALALPALQALADAADLPQVHSGT